MLIIEGYWDQELNVSMKSGLEGRNNLPRRPATSS